MSKDPIPMLDVSAQNASLLDDLLQAAQKVIRSGRYILGPEVDAFEREVADYIGVKHAVGVSSGTDALMVALMSLDIKHGDEVITTPFTFFATGGCIARVGATPVFVDIEEDTFNINVDQVASVISERTKAVLPVHLFGQSCDMTALRELATKHGLVIIEDAAQAIGAKHPDGPVGSLGDYGCFSFFPSKNLGGFGDAGLVTTRDDDLADRARVIRAHGSKPKYYHAVIGGNFRIDALQAALLRVKLPALEQWTETRRANADRYDQAFAAAKLGRDLLRAPIRRYDAHIFNQYVIRTSARDALQAHLKEEGVATAIYYPVPLHLQECFASLGHQQGSLPVSEKASQEVLALPIFAGLGVERQERIIDAVTSFLSK